MARKIIFLDADSDRYGIRVSYEDGRSGWIVGEDSDYLLFDTQKDAEKALRKMLRDNRYSWNCKTEVARFPK